MFAPGVISGSAFEGRWRLQDVGSTISKTGLTADWYRYSMIVTATTFQIKLLNLRTNVLLSGNVVEIGTVDSADNFAYTFLCYGISGTTGAYGSVGVNFSNARITRGSSTLFHAPLSEGYLAIIRDVVSKTAYALGFFTISAGWAKLADYYHYNFKNGYTLYTKAANPNIYVPNDSTGTEIPWTPLLSYVKVANYKGSTTSYNQCESKFKLDNVTTESNLYLADPDHVLFTEGTGVAKEFEIGSMHSEIVDNVKDRGHLYINEDSDANFMLYKTDKGVDTSADLKIWKYVEKE